jgi:MmyB-like transcription regulator ligand binding domain
MLLLEEKCHGIQRLRHPLVGELDLRLESFHLADDHEQWLTTYHTEPGSRSAEALRLLASWGTDATQARTGTPSAGMAR